MDGNRKSSTIVGFEDYTFGIVYAARNQNAYAGFYKNGTFLIIFIISNHIYIG